LPVLRIAERNFFLCLRSSGRCRGSFCAANQAIGRRREGLKFVRPTRRCVFTRNNHLTKYSFSFRFFFFALFPRIPLRPRVFYPSPCRLLATSGADVRHTMPVSATTCCIASSQIVSSAMIAPSRR
jgi:hypothetical protein